MITGIIRDISTAKNLIIGCNYLSLALKKDLSFAILGITNEKYLTDIQNALLGITANDFKIYNINSVTEVLTFCEEKEVSFLMIQSIKNSSKAIRKDLIACRELRIPYLLFKNEFDLSNIKNVILPVNFLEEEVEKAQFASAFGRFCDAEILILQAKDYGTKAANNVKRMMELFEKFSLKVKLQLAANDSFKVDKEAVLMTERNNSSLIIISSSRDYGLDDLIFGPKEQKLQKISKVPVLMVNPRGDLYALCD